ncbi:modular serine protease isoform X2 [Aethina tumida]|uniref:modular serine protease isoform X2 n=1 Tax=Aethina tumida TaxID=116153 RepID=UPI0021487BD9|nr:modular serine protease isoform X2 [Aethina tumida]
MRASNVLPAFTFLIFCNYVYGSSFWNVTRSKRQLQCGFRCRSDNKCLHISKECNGKVDCDDGSDEECANNSCPGYVFQCNYGACIKKEFVCDGKPDCKDNSDETAPICGTKQNNCRNDQFQCKNKDCIDFRYECNGRADCVDQSDETNHCNDQYCLPFLFRCNYGACINPTAKCNGVIDCVDGSDESVSLCGSTSPNPMPVTPSGAPPTVPTTKPTRTTTQGPILDNGECILPQHQEHGEYKLIIGGSYVPSTKVIPGTLIRLECKKTYGLNSNRTYTACIDGKWDESFTCLKSCKSLYSTKATKISCTYEDKPWSCAKAIEGTWLQFTCETFYENAGTDSWSYCSGGSWSFTPRCTPVCGQKRVDTAQLSVGGTKVVKGDYPWQVALFKNIGGSFENLCGGSLLNERIIITAAHCVTVESDLSNVVTNPKEFRVAAGKYYRIFQHPDDTFAQIREVSKIWYPEVYRGSLTYYIGDLALIQADKPFVLMKVVQPVCFDKSNILTLEPNKGGVVTGWGYTQPGGAPSDELQEIKIPYEDSAVCKTRLPSDFVKLYFGYDKFCAGYFNSSKALCEGDSGGALVFKQTDGKYYVKGIVSNAPRVGGSCDIQQYTLFTNVDKYTTDVMKFMAQYT